MRVRYHGSRNLGSLAAFYNDVMGLMTAPLNGKSLERIQHSSDHEEKSSKLESYPFSWARSPENLLCQETYLALATAFVLLRVLYFIFSTVCMFSMGIHPKHKVKELVGASSVIIESSSAVVQFLEGTVPEK